MSDHSDLNAGVRALLAAFGLRHPLDGTPTERAEARAAIEARLARARERATQEHGDARQ